MFQPLGAINRCVEATVAGNTVTVSTETAVENNRSKGPSNWLHESPAPPAVHTAPGLCVSDTREWPLHSLLTFRDTTRTQQALFNRSAFTDHPLQNRAYAALARPSVRLKLPVAGSLGRPSRVRSISARLAVSSTVVVCGHCLGNLPLSSLPPVPKKERKLAHIPTNLDAESSWSVTEEWGVGGRETETGRGGMGTRETDRQRQRVTLTE